MLPLVFEQICRAKKTIIFGIVLLTFVFLLFSILNFFIVRKVIPATYSSEIQLTLPVYQGKPVYYSNAPFSSHDMIAPQVLMTVYKELNLKRFISEKDFLSHVSIEESTPTRLAADAAYRSNLSARHLTPVQISEIVEVYQTALEQLSTRQYRIFLTAGVPKSVAAKVLEMIPNCWADLAKGKMLRRPPVFLFSGNQKGLSIFEKADLVDEQYRRLSSILDDIQLLCKNLQSASALDTGETATDLKHELDLACGGDQSMMLRRTVILNRSFSEEDKLFVASKLQRLQSLQAQAERLSEILKAPLFLSSEKMADQLGKPEKGTLVNVSENLSGLETLVNLATRHAKLTQPLFIRYMQNGEQLARLGSEVLTYTQIQKSFTTPNVSSVKMAVSGEMILKRIVAQEKSCQEKIEQMRTKLLNSCQNSSFFLPISPIMTQRESRWLLITKEDYGMFALLWLLCCLGYIFVFACPVLFESAIHQD